MSQYPAQMAIATLADTPYDWTVPASRSREILPGLPVELGADHTPVAHLDEGVCAIGDEADSHKTQ